MGLRLVGMPSPCATIRCRFDLYRFCYMQLIISYCKDRHERSWAYQVQEYEAQIVARLGNMNSLNKIRRNDVLGSLPRLSGVQKFFRGFNANCGLQTPGCGWLSKEQPEMTLLCTILHRRARLTVSVMISVSSHLPYMWDMSFYLKLSRLSFFNFGQALTVPALYFRQYS
ncbi:hypothetical protein PISMIDRAFT_234578 [Pisolithus microcarpus 441]|uniref:Uncharacterized protein n=1 Tax=Pisolithus microcarpus 441 TaxID=765257 RepID=A0A0C9Z427_9AGAM|nr:hypothetical protein PISMIDRAFT_234578 [Pisolithus microcarpus 441]